MINQPPSAIDKTKGLPIIAKFGIAMVAILFCWVAVRFTTFIVKRFYSSVGVTHIESR